MLGGICGDIIGSIYEYDIKIKTKEFPLFCEESSYTDDTVLTLSIADALLKVGKHASVKEIKSVVVSKLVEWTLMYPRFRTSGGYGKRFVHFILGEKHKPYGSYGNGAAMRISSVGWLYDDLKICRKMARITAKVSHNHRQGYKAAEAVASCICLARQGKEKVWIKKYVEKHFHYNLSRTLDSLRPNYVHSERAIDTVPEAIICFLESSSYEDTIRNAVSLGGDSDTIACMSGAIAEAYYGGVPDHIKEECMNRLDERMKNVLNQFCD